MRSTALRVTRSATGKLPASRRMVSRMSPPNAEVAVAAPARVAHAARGVTRHRSSMPPAATRYVEPCAAPAAHAIPTNVTVMSDRVRARNVIFKPYSHLVFSTTASGPPSTGCRTASDQRQATFKCDARFVAWRSQRVAPTSLKF